MKHDLENKTFEICSIYLCVFIKNEKGTTNRIQNWNKIYDNDIIGEINFEHVSREKNEFRMLSISIRELIENIG